MATNALTLPRSAEPSGLWSWITTVDHKRLGLLYLGTALLFFLIGGFEALLIRSQLAAPGAAFIPPDTYNQIVTMHGTTMIFLAAMPLNTGFGN